MSQQSLKLKLDIRSYWRAGSGDEAGAYADLLVIKKQGLPYLPGKQLKGILKNAMTSWVKAQLQPNSATIIEEIFGQEGANGQAAIEVSNANLPEIEKQWLLEDSERIKMLYHTKDTQAVDFEIGTTKPGSLRTMEVTIPMTLYAEINITKAINGYDTSQIKEWIYNSCLLITNIGANKNRGLGRVNITITELTDKEAQK